MSNHKCSGATAPNRYVLDDSDYSELLDGLLVCAVRLGAHIQPVTLDGGCPGARVVPKPDGTSADMVSAPSVPRQAYREQAGQSLSPTTTGGCA